MNKSNPLYDQKYYEMQEFGYSNEDRQDHRRMLEQLKLKKNDRVLEIGCGYGVLLTKLSVKKKIGIETNDTALKECKKRGLKVIKADAEKGLPFKDSSFDIVIMNEVIEHFKRPELVLDECYRILGPKGKLIMSTPVHSFFAHNLSHTHFSEMSVKELKKLAEKCNFKVISHEVNGVSFLYPLLETFLFKPFRNLRYGSQKKSNKIKTVKRTVGIIDFCHELADKTLLKPLALYRKSLLWLGLNQLLLAEKKSK